MAAHVGRLGQQGAAKATPEKSARFYGPERRGCARYAVDCPVLVVPLTGATKIAGRMVDLGMGGCRIETTVRVMVTIMMRVELQFQLRGFAFRLIGVGQGTRGGNFYAVRFQEISERKRVELAEVIAEIAQLEDQKAATYASPALEQAAVHKESVVTASVSVPPPVAPIPKLTLVPVATKAPPAVKPVSIREAPTVDSGQVAAASSLPFDPASLRVHRRHEVDTSGKLLLVKAGICMQSRILNLSLSGCRLRTEERFNLGIYVRVETEFYLHGLPFRLGGVSQAIVDKHTIGIRFLDVSERKRERLAELMAEIAYAEDVKVIADVASDGAAPAVASAG